MIGGLGEKQGALLRQADATAIAVEQLGAKLLFEQADIPAQGGLGRADLKRCPCKAARFGDRLKIA